MSMSCIIIYGFYIFFIVFFIIGCWSLKKVSKISDNLKDIAKKLKNNTEDRLDKYFQNSPLFHTWNEFSESFVEDRRENKIKGNTKRPYEFFNKEHIFLENKINQDFIESFSSRAVGLGMFGTFLGLTIGMMSLSSSIGNDKELMKGVEDLLGGAGLAFRTSCVGMFVSLLYSYIKGRTLTTFERQMHEISHVLEEKYDLITQEQILFDKKNILASIDENLNLKLDEAPSRIATELAPILNQVKEVVQQLVSSGGDLIEKNFENSNLKIEKIITKLSSSVDEMTTATETMSSNASKTSDTIFKGHTESGRRLNEILGKVSSTVNDLTTETSRSYEETTKAQEKWKTIVESTLNDAISQSTNRMTLKLSEALNALTEAQQEINSNQKNIQKENNIDLKHRYEYMEKLQESLNSTMQNFGNLLKQLQQKIESEKTSLMTLEKISSSTNQGLQNSQLIVQRMDEILKSLESFPNEIKNSFIDLKKTNTQMRNIWNNYKERFDKIDKSGALFLEELSNGFRVSLGKLHEQLSLMQEHIKTICSGLSGTAQELKETVEELKDK